MMALITKAKQLDIPVEDVPKGGIRVYTETAWDAMEPEQQSSIFQDYNVCLVMKKPSLLPVAKNWNATSFYNKVDINSYYQFQGK